jgi:hypothetical protein
VPGPARPCVECTQLAPVRAHGLCTRCYQRRWHIQNRKAQPAITASGQQHKLYPQAIVRVPGVRGWGFL